MGAAWCSQPGLPNVVVLPLFLQPRQNLLQAAGLVGQTSGELLQQIGESDTDPRFQVSGSGCAWGHTLGKSFCPAQEPQERSVLKLDPSTVLGEQTGQFPSLPLEPLSCNASYLVDSHVDARKPACLDPALLRPKDGKRGL